MNRKRDSIRERRACLQWTKKIINRPTNGNPWGILQSVKHFLPYQQPQGCSNLATPDFNHLNQWKKSILVGAVGPSKNRYISIGLNEEKQCRRFAGSADDSNFPTNHPFRPAGRLLKLIDKAVDKEDRRISIRRDPFGGSGWLQWTKEVGNRLSDGNPRVTR